MDQLLILFEKFEFKLAILNLLRIFSLGTLFYIFIIYAKHEGERYIFYLTNNIQMLTILFLTSRLLQKSLSFGHNIVVNQCNQTQLETRKTQIMNNLTTFNNQIFKIIYSFNYIVSVVYFVFLQPRVLTKNPSAQDHALGVLVHLVPIMIILIEVIFDTQEYMYESKHNFVTILAFAVQWCVFNYVYVGIQQHKPIQFFLKWNNILSQVIVTSLTLVAQGIIMFTQWLMRYRRRITDINSNQLLDKKETHVSKYQSEINKFNQMKDEVINIEQHEENKNSEIKNQNNQLNKENKNSTIV